MMTVAAKPGQPAPRVEGLFVRQENSDGSAPDGAEARGKACRRGTQAMRRAVRTARPRPWPPTAGRGSSAANPDLPAPGLIGRGLGKSFKRRPVLRGVNISVARGEVVGLLGANGAGKTTCFYIITGLDRGRYRDGHARWPRHHRPADVPPRAPRHRLSAAGSLDLSRADRRTEHPRHPRTGGAVAGDARGHARGTAGRVRDRPFAPRSGDGAVGRRTAAMRDRARSCDPAALHPSR